MDVEPGAVDRATIEPALSKTYDTYSDQLRDELLEWQREQTENPRPEISGSVAVEQLYGDTHL